MSNCTFCEILYRPPDPEQTILDGVSTLAIVPLNPVTPGHVIFIPRKHVRDATDPDVLAAVMKDVSYYVRGQQETYQRWPHGQLVDGEQFRAPAFNIITSVGEDATQTIFHLHVHVVPRRPGDGLTLPWTGQESK